MKAGIHMRPQLTQSRAHLGAEIAQPAVVDQDGDEHGQCRATEIVEELIMAATSLQAVTRPGAR